ncbi:MAG: hypothetical protein MJE68_16990, partial [Proteobacteria bacterium]|nr:hypothetical protein [Pseudomonadota bacterium]
MRECLALFCTGIFLFLDHPAGATSQRIIVPAAQVLELYCHHADFKIGFTEFNISCTSSSPLISQLLINNVTTEINGST